MLPSKASVKAVAFLLTTLVAAAVLQAILMAPWQFAALCGVTAIITGVLFFAGSADQEDPNREEPGDQD